jgi:hypothetical protein
MNADDFKKIKIGSKRKAIDPFLPDLLKLHESKYSLRAMCEFLKINGVVISHTALNNYLKELPNFNHQKKD